MSARQIAAEQAEDDGLWFVAETATEAYLQQELRRLTAAVEAESAWMPIETAPKDSNVLLTDGVNVSEGGWVSDVDQGAEWEGQLGMADWWSVSLAWKPTHWQPLPAPPEDA